MGLLNPFGNSYQVTEDDKDFLTLSANLGVDYNQLKGLNPSVQSLSQGQFIKVPMQGGSGATKLENTGLIQPPVSPLSPLATQQPVGTGSFISSGGAVNQSAGVPQNPNIYFQSEKTMTPYTPKPLTSLTGSFMPGGMNTPQAQAAVIANALNQSGFVPSMPITSQQMKVLVEQYGANPQLLSATHVFDAQTQTYKPKTTAGTGGNTTTSGGEFASTAAAQFNAQNNVPYLNQMRYDPKTRSYMPIGKILQKYGTLDNPRGQRERRQKKKEASIRGESASTSLNLVLGG